MRNEIKNKPGYDCLGQAMVEMIVVMFTTLLILFSLLHFGFLYNAKTILNYATHEAARAGSLNYGSPKAMNLALARGLAALKSPRNAVPIPSDYAKYQQSQTEAYEMIDPTAGNPATTPSTVADQLVCTQRISPATNSDHWRDVPNTVTTTNAAAYYNQSIPNDHLVYRSAVPDSNGVSIQDANLLKIRVTYCHIIMVPFIGNSIRRLMLQTYADNDPDPIDNWVVPNALGSLTKDCYRRKGILIEAQSVVRMQTPIRNYIFPANCS
ncbi:MAG: hypothetical protein ACJAUP_003455 [Cellvibrionaceae bacterium]|jgi:hypothetical protein